MLIPKSLVFMCVIMLDVLVGILHTFLVNILKILSICLYLVWRMVFL